MRFQSLTPRTASFRRGSLIASLSLALFACTGGEALATTTMQQIRFLGWSPSSREMAYELLEIDAKKKSSRKEVLKMLDGKMRLKPKKLGKTSLSAYVKEKKFVIEPLTPKKEGSYVTILSRKAREMVRVELEVKSQLAYRVLIKGKNKKWKLARHGTLDDLYNEIESAGFVSPDGLKVTVVLRLRTPYALKDVVLVVVTRY
ncbi:MAG: hypothetical protein KC609_03105 [Myxococcales bacterium]|nr:hypothetical protein [Myxococcales bacterium]